MNDTPTPRTDEWGTISKEDGHWSSHKRRERWIKTVPLKTSEELERELTAVTEQRDRLAEAIRKHKAAFPFAPDFCDVELYEALAAVEGGSDE